MKKKFLETGKIVGTHGVKGMVRIQPWSDSADFLGTFKCFYLDKEGSSNLNIEKIQPHGSVVIAKFENIDTIEAAESLRNRIIYIDRDEVNLPEGRYFIDDLIGCTVFDNDTNKELGVISEVSETGSNDVWHIIKSGKEYLFPAVSEFIVSVDIDSEKVVLKPLKGIFDDED